MQGSWTPFCPAAPLPILVRRDGDLRMVALQVAESQNLKSQ